MTSWISEYRNSAISRARSSRRRWSVSCCSCHCLSSSPMPADAGASRVAVSDAVSREGTRVEAPDRHHRSQQGRVRDRGRDLPRRHREQLRPPCPPPRRPPPRPPPAHRPAATRPAPAAPDPRSAQPPGRVKTSRTCPARPAARRSQPRTVSSGTPSSRRRPAMPEPARRRSQRRPGHRRLIHPPQQQPRGQQHVRHPARRAPGPARPHHLACPPPRPEDLPLPAMPPPSQPSPAARAGQTALFQHPLDAPGVVAYREHRCSFAPARGPPRGFAKRSRGGPPRNRHAHGVVAHHTPQQEHAQNPPAQPQ